MKRWLVLLMLLIQAVFAVGAEAAIQVPPKPSGVLRHLRAGLCRCFITADPSGP